MTAASARWAVLGLVGLLVAACGSAGQDRNADQANDQIVVVTTVAPITSIVSSVAGDRAEVIGTVPEGVNSHTYEPPPSVAEALAGADIVFLNGLQLEEPTRQLAIANVRDDVPVVALGDATLDADEYIYDFSFPLSEGKPNPHLWTDPTLALEYAALIRDGLIAVDESGTEQYQANYEAFRGRVDAFDDALVAALATVPVDRRKLVTYHDAYAYFAASYGWSVVGAVQPADFREPTAADVADLIDQIEAEQVPAVFGSEVFASHVLEQIANETGAIYVDDLRDDDLPGDPGDPEHSWFGLMRFNFTTMVSVLGGDASMLADFDIGDASDDQANYPQ